MNLLIIHLHDMGRYCSPYGHSLHSPNFQKFSDSATVFRQAHCGAPTCSPSRAVLLTGESSHQSGLIGLLHRGFNLKDQKRHLGYVLGEHGYETAYAGVQHEFTESAGPVPYKRCLTRHHSDPEERDLETTKAAVDFLREDHSSPFFLWTGFFLPHKPFLDHRQHDYPVQSVRAPDPLPDTPEVRDEMRDYAASLAYADECIGRILDTVEAKGLDKNTTIILTTDHGIPFPKMKCNLTDAGTGVALMIRTPKAKNAPRETDALVSHIDLFPTVFDLLELPCPSWAQGKSLAPLLEGANSEINECVFAEVNFHASYQPCRSVRTQRYKLIRYFHSEQTVLPNIDNGQSKQFLMERGLERSRPIDQVQLYDLHWDPNEANNLVDHPDYQEIREDLNARLNEWMKSTSDPILKGKLTPPSGAVLNALDAVHAEEGPFLNF